VDKLFFLLSGENETLPASELKNIIEAEGYKYKILENLDQAVRLEANINCIEAVERRAAFTKFCAQELFSCELDFDIINTKIKSINIGEILKKGESFAVRLKRVKSYSSKNKKINLEKIIGKIILDKTTKTKVNLKQPDKTFVGILTSRKFLFGLKIAEISSKPFNERRPKKRPFFHPSAMSAKLARCMVNIAQPKVGELVFDPLCGTGSMLIEAALIGCKVLGLDIQRNMVKGTIQNLEHFRIQPYGMVIADALKFPIRKVDCVVTDPPYGKSSTTMKRSTIKIIKKVLMGLHSMYGLKTVCISAPNTLNIGNFSETLGYKHIESHFVYVHKSLTREIAVFRRV
jgi:tRNA (guanine10-N2)-dimethyltransferase